MASGYTVDWKAEVAKAVSYGAVIEVGDTITITVGGTTATHVVTSADLS